MSEKIIIGDNPLIRDFQIPRRDNKLAILRLEFPISKRDIAHLKKWLEILENTLEPDPKNAKAVASLLDPKKEAARLRVEYELKNIDKIKAEVRANPAGIQFSAKDPIVIISGPAKPEAPASKGNKDIPPGSKPHFPPPLPEKKERGPYKKADSKRRPMKRSRSMGVLQVGLMRASASSKGLNTKNTPPEDLPEVKRICSDCEKRFPLSEFRGLFGRQRTRCQKCNQRFEKSLKV